MKRAKEDSLHAKSRAFSRRLERSLDAIREAAKKGRVGVSFSGGKDSLVTLHLVRSVIPDAPAALFDSGCEMPETLELAEHYDVEIIQPRLTYPEMARFSGWWGYPDPVDPGCPFDVKSVLIDQPAEVFVVRRRLSVCALGLRAQESDARAKNAASRGLLYLSSDRTWRLCPIAFWSCDDVWAYIVSRGLRYHPVYDEMERIGIPRDRQRLGMSLGFAALEDGRAAVMRRVAPRHFARLAEEFPKLREVS